VTLSGSRQLAASSIRVYTCLPVDKLVESAMMVTVDQIVREHVKASRQFRKSIKGSPAKARAFLVRVGVLKRNGARPSKRGR
jgi:hypothetical protein